MLDVKVKGELPDGSLLLELEFMDRKTILDFAALGFMAAITKAAEEQIAEKKKIDELVSRKEKLVKARKKLKAAVNKDKSKRKRKNASA